MQKNLITPKWQSPPFSLLKQKNGKASDNFPPSRLKDGMIFFLNLKCDLLNYSWIVIFLFLFLFTNTYTFFFSLHSPPFFLHLLGKIIEGTFLRRLKHEIEKQWRGREIETCLAKIIMAPLLLVPLPSLGDYYTKCA